MPRCTGWSVGMADRGVRLGDLDRAQRYVLAYVTERKRWEVVGLADRMAVENPPQAESPAHSRLGASQLDPGEI